MRNILKAIVFTGIMGVATATWGTLQSITVGDFVMQPASEINGVPDLIDLRDNNVPTCFGIPYFRSDYTGTVTIQLISIVSNFQNGDYHGLILDDPDSHDVILGNQGKRSHTGRVGHLGLALTKGPSSYALTDSVISVPKYLESLGLTDQKQVDFSAVYRIKITAKSGETEVSKCFDLLVGGKCDLSTQKAPLEVIPEETIPDILTKNANGQIVFAPPRPVGIVRLPKGHTCSSITLASPNVYKAGTETKEPSDISTLQIKGRLKDTGEWGTEIKKADGIAITETDVIELVVDSGKSGNIITTPEVSGEFDWSSVIRMSLTPVA